MIDESAVTGVTEWAVEKARKRFGIAGAVIAFLLCLVVLVPLVILLTMWLDG